MVNIGRYCKAYPIEKLREFRLWEESISPPVAGPQTRGERSDIANVIEPKYLFVHEDYTVTSNIFPGRDVVFDKTTDEWIAFCKQALELEIPDPTSEATDQIAQS